MCYIEEYIFILLSLGLINTDSVCQSKRELCSCNFVGFTVWEREAKSYPWYEAQRNVISGFSKILEIPPVSHTVSPIFSKKLEISRRYLDDISNKINIGDTIQCYLQYSINIGDIIYFFFLLIHTDEREEIIQSIVDSEAVFVGLFEVIVFQNKNSICSVCLEFCYEDDSN